MSRISTSSHRDGATNQGSYQQRDSSSHSRNPFAIQKSRSSNQRLSSDQDNVVEREGRLIKVNREPVVILDSSDTEDASSNSQNSREDTKDGRLSVDGIVNPKRPRTYPSFSEETPSATSYTSKRSAHKKAQKRIDSTVPRSLSDSLRSWVNDKEALERMGKDTKKAKMESKIEEKYANMGGHKVSQSVRRDQERQRGDVQLQHSRSSSSTFVSLPNTRSRPVMSSGTDSDEMFDPLQNSKPSERASRYKDKLLPLSFCPQKSVKAITNSATPRPPLRHDSSESKPSNTQSFYSQDSLTTPENSRLSRKAHSTPTTREKKVKRLRLGGSGGKSCRRVTKEEKKPECIVLDSGDDDEKSENRVKEYSEEKNQLSNCDNMESSETKQKEISEDMQLEMITPLLHEIRPKANLPLKTLMIGTLQLKPTTPAVLRRENISFRYINPIDHDTQRQRCFTIETCDITVVKSNLFDKSIHSPVVALQTRSQTTSKLQSIFAMKDIHCQYNPKGSVPSEQFIVLVLKESLEDQLQYFIKHTVETATKQSVLWQDLSKDEFHTFVSGVDVGEKTETSQQPQQVQHATSATREHRTRSAVKSKKAQGLKSIYRDEDSDDGGNEELKSFTSSEKEELEEPERVILRYKSSCTYGATGITITTGDLSLLKPTCWLNDKLVNFYLMYLYDSVLSEEQKQRTYIYSTFLFEKLNEMRKRQRRRSGPDCVEEDKKQLRRWTKDVSLLSKDFLVIPINQSNVHWYLVIVCYAHLAFSNTSQESLGNSLEKRSSSTTFERSPGGQGTDDSQGNVTRSQLGQVASSEIDVASYTTICSTPRSNSSICINDLSETNSTDFNRSNRESNCNLSDNISQKCNTPIAVCDSTETTHTPHRWLDRGLDDDQTSEPASYFRTLAAESDVSCSDHVMLFGVPPFEGSDVGHGQAENGSATTLSEKARLVTQGWSQVIKADGNRSGMGSGSEESTSEEKRLLDVPSSSQMGNEESADDSSEDAFSRTLASRKKRGRSSKGKGRPNKVVAADPIEQMPCIMFFDSLKCSGRKADPAKLIRDYLTSEYQSQWPDGDFKFDPKNLPAEYPKVPSQPNSCDCGVFVCQFVESFFQDPIKDYRSPIFLFDWFSPEFVVSHKRQELRNLIENLGKLKDTQPDESKNSNCK